MSSGLDEDGCVAAARPAVLSGLRVPTKSHKVTFPIMLLLALACCSPAWTMPPQLWHSISRWPQGICSVCLHHACSLVRREVHVTVAQR